MGLDVPARTPEEHEARKDKCIVAVDLMTMLPIPGVTCIKGDITRESTAREIVDLFGVSPSPGLLVSSLRTSFNSRTRVHVQGNLADIVVVDGAPDGNRNAPNNHPLHPVSQPFLSPVTGMHDVDEFVQHQLVYASLTIATHVLSPGGSFVAKVFRGKLSGQLYAHLGKFFESVVISKPKACRNSSLEGFVVCRGFTAPTHPTMNVENLVTLCGAPEPQAAPFQACGSSRFDSDRAYSLQEDIREESDLAAPGHELPAGDEFVYIAPHALPVDPPYRRVLEQSGRASGFALVDSAPDAGADQEA